MKRKKDPHRHPFAAFLRQHAGMLLGSLLLGVLAHDVFGERGFLAMRRSQKEVEVLQQEIALLNAENSRISAEVQALKTDPKMIERIAREELNLARKGEFIFKLPPKPQTHTTPPQPPK